MDKMYEMSFFNGPITNKVPLTTLGLIEVAAIVKSKELEPQTVLLRSIIGHEAARQYKGTNFPYVTPAGVFSYCSDASLVRHSDGLKQKLIADPRFKTLMAFRSPSGDGLKWFIEIDLTRCNHRQWFDAVRNYLMSLYGLSPKQADPSVRNESRACFLCYDPEVYVNPVLTVDK